MILNVKKKFKYIFFRYVDIEEIKIKEEFPRFVELSSASDSAIKDRIIKPNESYHLNLNNFRGQRYDDGSNMSDRNNGIKHLS